MRLILILILFWSCFSCASKTPKSGKSTVGLPVGNYYEDLSEFLPKYELPKPLVNPADNLSIVADKSLLLNKEKTSHPVGKSDTDAVDAALMQMTEQNIKLNANKGFRIQLFVGNNKEDFLACKNYIFRNYPELSLYEYYSQPTYKIKVGEFLTREEAQNYIDFLKSKYTTARILSERIDIKKAIENK